MATTIERNGTCLCGSVRLKVTLTTFDVVACHCAMCRRWGGGPLLAVTASQTPLIEGEAVTLYDSSSIAQRAFCGRCGTHLYYRGTQDDRFEIPVGLFKDQAAWTFDEEIFIDAKPAWYCFAGPKRQYTERQVLDGQSL